MVSPSAQLAHEATLILVEPVFLLLCFCSPTKRTSIYHPGLAQSQGGQGCPRSAEAPHLMPGGCGRWGAGSELPGVGGSGWGGFLGAPGEPDSLQRSGSRPGNLEHTTRGARNLQPGRMQMLALLTLRQPGGCAGGLVFFSLL